MQVRVSHLRACARSAVDIDRHVGHALLRVEPPYTVLNHYKYITPLLD